MHRVAVAGGGIFGCTIAVELARAGSEVMLFERKPQLLRGASATNLFRVHRGYHYPRDPRTAMSTEAGERSFRERYPDAIVSDSHYYAIAAEGSLTSAADFESFCSDVGLKLAPEPNPLVIPSSVEACYQVEESRYVPERLRAACERQLADAGVTVYLDTETDRAALDEFDIAVLTTYSSLNDLGAFGDRQFEVCEVPVVRLPPEYAGQSVVILDGAFMSFDPLDHERHAIYHVEHSIHHRNIGTSPEIPAAYEPFLDRGPVDAGSLSRFDAIRDAGRHFFAGFEPELLGSMFTVRAVLPGVDATDARPTIIEWIDDQTIMVFSGKVVTAVEAAGLVSELVRGALDQAT